MYVQSTVKPNNFYSSDHNLNDYCYNAYDFSEARYRSIATETDVNDWKILKNSKAILNEFNYSSSPTSVWIHRTPQRNPSSSVPFGSEKDKIFVRKLNLVNVQPSDNVATGIIPQTKI